METMATKSETKSETVIVLEEIAKQIINDFPQEHSHYAKWNFPRALLGEDNVIYIKSYPKYRMSNGSLIGSIIIEHDTVIVQINHIPHTIVTSYRHMEKFQLSDPDCIDEVVDYFTKWSRYARAFAR